MEDEIPGNAADFQIVLNKQKRKKQRAALNKSVHATRSKAGKSKPLQ